MNSNGVVMGVFLCRWPCRKPVKHCDVRQGFNLDNDLHRDSEAENVLGRQLPVLCIIEEHARKYSYHIDQIVEVANVWKDTCELEIA